MHRESLQVFGCPKVLFNFHFFLSYFNLFRYYSLAPYPLAQGYISDSLTDSIEQES